MDFREFPFDEQIFPISLLVFGYTPEEVELVFESVGSERKFSISDWSIEAVGPEQFDYAVDLFDNSDMIMRSR